MERVIAGTSLARDLEAHGTTDRGNLPAWLENESEEKGAGAGGEIADISDAW